MSVIIHTTVVVTADGKTHNLGRGEYPPRHDHSEDKKSTCARCRIVDARTQPSQEKV